MKTALLLAVCAASLAACVETRSGRTREVAGAGTGAATVAAAHVSTRADVGDGATSRIGTRYSGSGRVGDSVPDFELMSMSGEQVSLGSLRGRAVLLNLWATWCAPCLHEMPELAALHRQFASRGLVVVGMNEERAQPAKLQAFVSERQIPFAVWLDPEMRTANALRVLGLPATFVIDPRGRIVLRRNGAITADDPEVQQALEIASAVARPTRPPS